MPRYRLTVHLDFDAPDDAAAREAVGISSEYATGRLAAAILGAEHNSLNLSASHGAAKLQHMYGNQKPRLLAKWPEDV